MPKLALLAALAASTLLAGCETVPPAERAAACQATDWRQYGYNDGRLGVPAAERTEHFADCAKLGRPADTTAYQSGRAAGLREYCTVDNGYEVGRAGRQYRKVCPPELEQGFLQGYDEGRREYRRDYRVYPYFGLGIGISSFYGSYGFNPWWPYYPRPYYHRRPHDRAADRDRP